MEIAAEKKDLLKKIIHWYKNIDQDKPYLTLGGYAGTGKTTLLAILRRILAENNPKFKVAFASYTGKATRVLKNYLESAAVLIYSPIEDDKDEIIGWKRKEELEANLIIIDEASMIDERIWRDLLSYQVPILAVGDHGQLPPISGRFNLMQEPDLRLETIFRQAANNPIIRLSVMAREKGEIPLGHFGQHVLKISKRDSENQELVEEYLQNFNSETLVLCAYNHTRVRLNNYLRQLLGFESPEPQAGDRVICLRNNQAKGIFNGMLGKINWLADAGEYYEMKIDLDDQAEKGFEGKVLKSQFGAKEAMNFTYQRRKTLKVDLFDFAYAITVHKAQGSQAKRVILFEERFKQMSDDDWRRWLYTAVTRAEEELIIIGD